jgi:tetratricopeptide (TPR) repeat protein
MASKQKSAASAMEIDRLATQLAKDPHSKAFLPLAEEYCKVGMWEEAVAVLEDGLKYYPGFITAMVALGRAYDQLKQPTKARAVLEGAVKLSPDNLRAHRTLIKIYAAQGLTDAALQSCNVILAMNPRDEEALSVQASLGVSAKSEPVQPKPPVPIQAKSPTQEQPALSAESAEQVDATAEVPLAFRIEAPAALGDGTVATDFPISMATSTMENALAVNTHKQAEEICEHELSCEGSRSTSEPPLHAKTIAQLESWLRSIERQRRDRAISGDPSS